MSVAPSIPSIKIKISRPPHPCRFSFKPSTIIRSSNGEGPMRRPAAPSLSRSPPPPPSLSAPPSLSPTPSMKPATPSQSPPKPAEAAVPTKEVVTLEYQRKVAKELQEYFKQKKLEEAVQGPFFGFMGKNEIINGRWAMFGFAVGLLTEYATGSDFVQQLKILLSNFGIVDLE
ncbi:light-harvesting complex-like protein OHP2, chloroplastic [Phoenix dactylifera]|uniref:Light-harvesting complex-like protein OHP2, chloroplastic n=1 Tax=Phoenix dactylifera TaxID=42345 RepID=A0A8B7BJ15_PHODC|nr:light-harvesting complex-like protein OHP2, chloroplastic [Phoenix dactylifera]